MLEHKCVFARRTHAHSHTHPRIHACNTCKIVINGIMRFDWFCNKKLSRLSSFHLTVHNFICSVFFHRSNSSSYTFFYSFEGDVENHFQVNQFIYGNANVCSLCEVACMCVAMLVIRYFTYLSTISSFHESN